MSHADDFAADQVALQITRALRRARFHRADGNPSEAFAAETSMNGWIEQYGRLAAAREPA